MRNFRYFFREGVGNMLSHGFMSFAAIGVTVACLLIMGTFSLVAYNANENLADLQQENAVLAFVDDSLTEREAEALQTKLEKVDNVADCTFMSRDEAKENYIEKYDGDELYGDLPADVFRHRYVIHVTDPDRIMETKTAVEQVPGIAKARAGSRAVARVSCRDLLRIGRIGNCVLAGLLACLAAQDKSRKIEQSRGIADEQAQSGSQSRISFACLLYTSPSPRD